KDAALERRFQPVKVREATIEESIEILKGVRERYEDHHKVKITDEAVKLAAEMAGRYVTDRFLPDKAIDVIDEASAKVKIRAGSTPQELRELIAGIEDIVTRKDLAIAESDYETADELRTEERTSRARAEQLETEWAENRCDKTPEVTEDDVLSVVSVWTGIPVSRIAEEESQRLLQMEEELHTTVVS
ncbi:MAG: hypothetical protein QF614_09360, partial [SAR324 cluster bacterium]|nr:hypothetical protein [SAR324 cluster bacterium]